MAAWPASIIRAPGSAEMTSDVYHQSSSPIASLHRNHIRHFQTIKE
jgi:hypothetical protein